MQLMAAGSASQPLANSEEIVTAVAIPQKVKKSEVKHGRMDDKITRVLGSMGKLDSQSVSICTACLTDRPTNRRTKTKTRTVACTGLNATSDLSRKSDAR